MVSFHRSVIVRKLKSMAWGAWVREGLPPRQESSGVTPEKMLKIYMRICACWSIFIAKKVFYTIISNNSLLCGVTTCR